MRSDTLRPETASVATQRIDGRVRLQRGEDGVAQLRLSCPGKMGAAEAGLFAGLANAQLGWAWRKWPVWMIALAADMRHLEADTCLSVMDMH